MAFNKYIIGVTGHRNLPPEKILELIIKIKLFYQEKIILHGIKNIIVLSPVAEGADTLCAKLALESGLSLIIPLPMDKSEYLKDFSGSAAAEFEFLLLNAKQVFPVSPEEPIPPASPRGFYYRQAGIYIAKHCDILIAIWDGVEKNTPDGAGTWETIKLARENLKPVINFSV